MSKTTLKDLQDQMGKILEARAAKKVQSFPDYQRRD